MSNLKANLYADGVQSRPEWSPVASRASTFIKAKCISAALSKMLPQHVDTVSSPTIREPVPVQIAQLPRLCQLLWKTHLGQGCVH